MMWMSVWWIQVFLFSVQGMDILLWRVWCCSHAAPKGMWENRWLSKGKGGVQSIDLYCFLVWFILLMACQLLIGYLMLKVVSIHWLYQGFLSNTNNLYKAICFQAFLLNIDDLYTIIGFKVTILFDEIFCTHSFKYSEAIPMISNEINLTHNWNQNRL